MTRDDIIQYIHKTINEENAFVESRLGMLFGWFMESRQNYLGLSNGDQVCTALSDRYPDFYMDGGSRVDDFQRLYLLWNDWGYALDNAKRFEGVASGV